MTNEFGLTGPLFNVTKFLRNSASLNTTESIMGDRRVESFKGSQASKLLSSPEYSKLKGVPKVTSNEDSEKILQELLDAGVFIRAKQQGRSMQPDLSRTWSDEAFYVWVYKGSQLFTILGAIAFLAVSFFLASYQMWPDSLRKVTWYVLMLGFVFLGLLLAISIVRLIVFVITYFSHAPGIWIFPNLFEDVSFIDSFIPAWDWHGAPCGPAAIAARKKAEMKHD